MGEGAVITQEGNLNGHGEKQDKDTKVKQENTPK
jgi:stress response protein SCP2